MHQPATATAPVQRRETSPQEVVTVNVLNGPTGRDSWRRTPPPLVGWMMAGWLAVEGSLCIARAGFECRD